MNRRFGIRSFAVAIIVGLVFAGCRQDQRVSSESPRRSDVSVPTVSPAAILEHIQVLSSTEFEGRAPGTAGEDRTVAYLVQQFKGMGLRPGNPNDGSFIQKVPLAGFTAEPTISFSAAAGAQAIDLRSPTDAVAWTRRSEPVVKIEKDDVIFVGYGVVAPEYQWDDYKDVDVRGKTVMILINDPPVPLDPSDPDKLDDRVFKGRAMTYYGRWTYKYEEAARRGAAAAIIVHQTGPAGYPWGVIMMSSGREGFDLKDATAGHCDVEGWVTLDSAKRLCAAAGKDFDALKRSAVSRDFRPVPLNLKADIAVKTTLREIASRNVIAKTDGVDPALKDEYVIYTAHWDHLGRDPKRAGDQVFHGASDNASGTAMLLELARAFSQVKPKRTIVFLSVTAEEKGLLGARYYVTHPLYPLRRTLANINIDGINVWGRARDVGVIGAGQSTLEDRLVPFARAQGRVIVPESQPEKGFYFRSDHFEFAKVGVPALFLDRGTDYIGRPAGWGRAKREAYIEHDYHQVTDTIKPDWDLTGAAEDAQLLFQVGYAVAQDETNPQWKSTSEFRSAGEERLRR